MSNGFRQIPLSATGGTVFLIALVAAFPALAATVSGTDPSTIINSAITLAIGPLGIGIATLGLMVMICMVPRFGMGALLMYCVIVAGFFGSGFIVQQLTGGSGAS